MENNKKANILLVIFLIITLMLDALLGYRYIQDKKKIPVPDLIGQNASELYEWCGSLNPRYACKIVYETTKEHPKDEIFHQSIAAGQTLTGDITFKVSSGLIESISRPTIDADTTRTMIEKWASKNGIEDITYIEEESTTVEKGIVIRIEPLDNIYADTPIKVYISSGSKDSDTKEEDTISVEYGKYIGKTVSDFEKTVKELGLVPKHTASRDAYSSTVKEGNIVWHGSGSYVKNEEISYGISKGVNENEIIVSPSQYVGLSEEEFIRKANELKLTPNHKTERDDYSDNIPKGKIVWHGSGTYEEKETFNYGLSLGKKSETNIIEIEAGAYIGKTVEEFEEITKGLKLKPYHDEGVDAYSDTIEKGRIVWHGSGDYEVDESIRYGLSLGKADPSDLITVKSGYVGKDEDELIEYLTSLGMKYARSAQEYSDTYEKGQVTYYDTGDFAKGTIIYYKTSLGKDERVNVESFHGKTESEFLSYLEGKGLKAGKRTEVNSSDIEKGSIVSNDTGSFDKGSSINYKVSIGPSQETAMIMRPQYYANFCGNDFETTKSNLKNGPFSVFTNVEYIKVKHNLNKGQIQKITVYGDDQYGAGDYPVDASIKIYIVNEVAN